MAVLPRQTSTLPGSTVRPPSDGRGTERRTKSHAAVAPRGGGVVPSPDDRRSARSHVRALAPGDPVTNPGGAVAAGHDVSQRARAYGVARRDGACRPVG